MNISQIFIPLFSQLWWIILLFAAAVLFKVFKPFLKGKVGELAVAVHVKLYLKDPRYILLNDCALVSNKKIKTHTI